MFYRDCLNTITEQSERQLSSYWQMVVCGVCVCVCMSACTLVRFLACGGLGSGVWGGRGGGEEWGEVSRGTAGETPTLTSCCLKRVRQQPACLPASSCLSPSLSVLPPPPLLSLCCVPLRTQPSCSKLSTLLPCHYAPWPPQKESFLALAKLACMLLRSKAFTRAPSSCAHSNPVSHIKYVPAVMVHV